jgi:glutamate-1-semialdehyde 2,1-aminomutase
MKLDQKIVEEYKRTHPRSLKLHEDALKVFAADGATHSVRVFDPFLPYITHANGSRTWDVDGNEYIDYVMGHGALILGHCHPEVLRAVQDQLYKGVHFGSNHPIEVEWAQLIQSMMPCAERVEFFPCGNEANMMAIRLARTFTGRKKVLKFEEHFHGWADHLVEPGTPGVLPEDNIINTVTIPANDLSRVEEELAKKEYALLMTEGGGGHMGGQVPLDKDFVCALPDLTRQYGTVWCIDEVVTGFRDSPGGWQAIAGVKPQLTTLGKCIGGGLAVGALVGRADIMSAFKPLKPKNPGEKEFSHSGTWNANPLTAAAGVASCNLYRDGAVQKKVGQLAAYIRKKGNEVLKETGIQGTLYGRSIVHLYLGSSDFEVLDDTLPPTKNISKIMIPSKSPTRKRLCLHMLQRGISIFPSGGKIFILSIAHTKDDMDKTVQAFRDSLHAMIVEGSLDNFLYNR